MAKTGRPRAEIDQAQFEKLCKLQCTESEICSWFNVSDKTLDRWCHDTYKSSFSVIFKQKREQGHISLRRTQWQLAEKNPTMAIWLGKQHLGQTDKVNMDVKQQIQPETINAVEALINANRRNN